MSGSRIRAITDAYLNYNTVDPFKKQLRIIIACARRRSIPSSEPIASIYTQDNNRGTKQKRGEPTQGPFRLLLLACPRTSLSMTIRPPSPSL